MTACYAYQSLADLIDRQKKCRSLEVKKRNNDPYVSPWFHHDKPDVYAFTKDDLTS